MDLEGTITAWNQAAERMYGYAAAGSPASRSVWWFPEERQDEESAVLDRIARGEHVKHFETVRCRKDGTRFPVSLSLSPIRDERGRVIGASKIARDITERQRASQHAALLAEVGAVLAGSLEYETTLKTVANLAVPAIADWCAVDILTEERKLERAGRGARRSREDRSRAHRFDRGTRIRIRPTVPRRWCGPARRRW